MRTVCGNCKFFKKRNSDEFSKGRCYRYPPQLLHRVKNGGSPRYYFEAEWINPEVQPTSFCGEWKKEESNE